MKTTATATLLNNMQLYYSNPSAALTNTLNVLEEALDGMDIVDVTNPFVALLECAATGHAAHILKSESLNRHAYPKLALTHDDLYHHIADSQYIGIFGLPSICNVVVMVPLSSIKNNAISVGGSSTKTIVIPGGTKFTIKGNVTLEVGYPIHISVLPNGIVTARYDNSISNPLLPINTNAVESRKVTFAGVDYFQLVIPCLQTNTTSTVFALNELSSFTQNIPFSDYYVHLRAYISRNGGDWVEIQTTHSPKVYDVRSPTVKLGLQNSAVNVMLPDIYQSLLLSGNALRVDVISTKGNITDDLKQVETGAWAYTFIDHNTIVSHPAIAPLKKINDIIVYSTDSLWGGQLPITFEELRNTVIYNGSSVSVPIRPSDIVLHLNRRGYSAKKIIDTVTNRVYVGCKPLPAFRTDTTAITPLGTNQLVNFKTTDPAIAGAFNKHQTNRITVLPSTLYKLENDNVAVVQDSKLTALLAMSTGQLLDELNNNCYLCSLFYYVLDYSELVFRTRVYHLDDPTITGRTLEAVNEKNDYGLATMSVAIANNGNRYTVTVIASVPSGTNGLVCQLRAKDEINDTYGYISSTGVITGIAAVYTFDLYTKFDVSSKDLLFIKMLSSSNIEIEVPVKLENVFDMFYFMEGDNTGLETVFGSQYSDYNYNNTIGIAHETVTVKFGENMKLLYCPAKELLPTPTYQAYTVDVPDVYTEPVYASGPYGRLYTIVDDHVEFIIEHQVGDPRLDDNGDPIMLHRMGDPILDYSGKMIPTSSDALVSVKQCGVTLVDAKFRFSTDPAIKTYLKTIPVKINEYLNKEIQPLSIKMNELTHLYYTPPGDIKHVSVNLGNNTYGYVPPLVAVDITFIVTEYASENSDITDGITERATAAVSKMLSGKTLSVSMLISTLMSIDKDSIVGCTVNRFLPNGINYMTVVEDGVNLSLETMLYVKEDGYMSIGEKILITYKKEP